PARLFVTRVNAVVNGVSAAADNSQFGVGGIDADGNLYFRSDVGAPAANGPNVLTGVNYFRVDSLARNPAQTNHISNLLAHRDAGATAHLLQTPSIAHNPPTGIPEDLAGNPVLIGSNFNNQYVRGINT